MTTRVYYASPNGAVQFDVAASEYIFILSPSDTATIDYKAKAGSGTEIDLWVNQTSVTNGSLMISSLSEAQKVRVTAGPATAVTIGIATSSAAAAFVVGDNRKNRYNVEAATFAANGTITAEHMMNGVIIDSANTDTLTLTTGASLNAAVPYLTVGETIDFCINKANSSTDTSICTQLATATGISLASGVSGDASLKVYLGTTGRFRIRKTGSSTYTLCRV